VKEKNNKIKLLRELKIKNIFLESEFFERTSKNQLEKIDEISIKRGYVYEQVQKELNLIVTYRIFLERENTRVAYYTITFREIFETDINFESLLKNSRAKKFYLENYADKILWPYLRIYLNEVLMKSRLPQIILPINIENQSI
jgi:preprotein translocase subunit SecB